MPNGQGNLSSDPTSCNVRQCLPIVLPLPLAAGKDKEISLPPRPRSSGQLPVPHVRALARVALPWDTCISAVAPCIFKI